MPLTLNVGVSKKLGQRDYGSLGASCNLTVELDGSLLQHDLDAFQQRVRDAYVACAQAVNDELARQQQGDDGQTNAVPPASGNGHTSATASNGTKANGRNGNGHRVSTKQLDYVRQLAGQITGMGVRRLETLCGNMYGKPLAELSSLEASGLIDTLKEIKAGTIDLAAVLGGASS